MKLRDYVIAIFAVVLACINPAQAGSFLRDHPEVKEFASGPGRMPFDLRVRLGKATYPSAPEAQAMIRKWLGLTLSQVPPRTMGPLRSPGMMTFYHWFRIDDVESDSVAYAAGLRAGMYLDSFSNPAGVGGGTVAEITGVAVRVGSWMNHFCMLIAHAREPNGSPAQFLIFPKEDQHAVPERLRKLFSKQTIAAQRLRLFYEGSIDKIKCLHDADITGVISGPAGLLLGFDPKSAIRLAERSGYAGLIAQYIMFRTQQLGLCGDAATGFEETTTYYTAYKDQFGNISNKTIDDVEKKVVRVPSRFAKIVDVGMSSSKINSSFHRDFTELFGILTTCDDPDRIRLEQNMLKFQGRLGY